MSTCLGKLEKVPWREKRLGVFQSDILQVACSGAEDLPVTSWVCWTSCFLLRLGFCMSSTVSIWASARAQYSGMGASCGCRQWEVNRDGLLCELQSGFGMY